MKAKRTHLNIAISRNFYDHLFISRIFSFQGGGDGSQQQKAAERQQQVEDMKNSILSQVLTQEARARCNLSF